MLQRAYTALLVRWVTEMVLGAREGGGAERAGAPPDGSRLGPAEPGGEVLEEAARLAQPG